MTRPPCDDRAGPPHPATRFLDDHPAQPLDRLDWLWPQRLPLGSLALLIGDPGVGKSLLVADLAARVSTARPWPDEPASAPGALTPAPSSPHFPFGVILVAPEDSPADTLLPRLIAAGADLSRICILDGVSSQPTFSLPHRRFSATDASPSGPVLDDPPDCLPLSLPDHLPALQEAIRAVANPRLVVLDPLHAVLSPAAHGNPVVLAALLADLSATADRYNVALVAVCHLSKTRSHRFIYRVRGSLALTAAARVVLLVSADPAELDRRLLTPVKNVYGAPPPARAFHITPGPRLEWQPEGGTCEPAWPACHDLLDLSPDAHSALYDACAWLADYLSTGPQPALDVLRAARAVSLAPKTLRRAKRLLAVRSVKSSNDSGWLWSVAPQPDNQHGQWGGVRA